jgi:hypothetical protein
VRILATVSYTGLVPSSSATKADSCDVCEQFSSLYEDVQAADKQLASFSGRRGNYGPKQNALVKVKKSHMNFDNWLMRVEATAEWRGRAPPEAKPSEETGRPTVDKELQGTKRSLSLSRSPSPTSTLPSSRISTHSLPQEGKRLKFSDSVEFREDYRPCELYSRNGEVYVPGRYAPAHGIEHLDTSGSVKTFLKFTGMKKVGKEWVDVWKEDDDEDSEEGKKKVAYTRSASTIAVDAGRASSREQDDTMPSEVVPMGARAQRLARRSSITSETTLPRRNATRRNQAKGPPPVSGTNVATTLQLNGTTSTVTEGAVEAHVQPTIADMDSDDERAKSGNVARVVFGNGPIRQAGEAYDTHILVVCDPSPPTAATVDNAVTVRGIVESHPAGSHDDVIAAADGKPASHMDRQHLDSAGRKNATLPSQRKWASVDKEEPQSRA